MPADPVNANAYRGTATCGWKLRSATPCENPARWMPVLVFVAAGFSEKENTRIPAALTSVGTCDVCREAATADLAKEVVPGFRDNHLNPMLRRAHLVPVRFDRVEWVEIARAA